MVLYNLPSVGSFLVIRLEAIEPSQSGAVSGKPRRVALSQVLPPCTSCIHVRRLKWHRHPPWY